MAGWVWVEKVGKYRDSAGHYLARDKVLSFVNESIAASDTAIGPLSAAAAGGSLSPADFNLLARAELKQEYLRQYMLGIGGRSRMTPADWGRVGSMLKEQYKYLGEFSKEIADGKLSEAQIKARLHMYLNSSRSAYERAHSVNAKNLGMDEEAWLMGQVAGEHCEDCLALNAKGWQPIGTFPIPGDGSTSCLTSCACSVDYRNSKTGDWY
jgi:hypothetical protein